MIGVCQVVLNGLISAFLAQADGRSPLGELQGSREPYWSFHALIPTIGPKDEDGMADPSRASEVPILNGFLTLNSPQSEVWLLVDGILLPKDADGPYRDCCSTWKGTQKSTNGTSDVGSRDVARSFIEVEMLTEAGGSLVTNMDVGPDDEYSFKQNRLLKRLAVPTGDRINALRILSSKVELTHWGWLTVRCFAGDKRILSPPSESDVGKPCVRFELFLPEDNPRAQRLVALGEPVTFTAAGKTELNDILVPVGLSLRADTIETRRHVDLSDAAAGSTIVVDIRGVFIFSGYALSRYHNDKNSNDMRFAGGSGGWQDVSYRYDQHSQSTPEYPVTATGVKARGGVIELMIFDSLGKRIVPKTYPSVKDSRHSYKLEFQLERPGRVYFYQADRNAFVNRANNMTLDNLGAYLVSVDKVK